MRQASFAVCVLLFALTMRRPVLLTLLTVSFALNLALGGWWWARERAESAAEAEVAAAAKRNHEDARMRKAARSEIVGAEEAASPLAAALERRDARATRDLLRKCGVPEAVLLNTVGSLMRRWNEAEFNTRFPDFRSGRNWWSSEESQGLRQMLDSESTQFGDEQTLAYLKGLDELFPGRFQEDDWSTRTDFQNVAPERRETMRRARWDFLTLRLALGLEMGDFKLPTDKVAYRLVESEYWRDVANIMTPEERVRFELENSAGGRRLRDMLGKVNGTLEEARALALRFGEHSRQFEDKSWYAMPDDDEAAEFAEKKKTADAALAEELRRVLGEERAAAATAKKDPDLALLEAAAERFNLPRSTVDTVYASGREVLAASQRIAADPALDDVARKQALAELARETRGEIVSLLGEDIAKVYLEKRMTWLQKVEEGATLELDAQGRLQVRTEPTAQ